MISVDEYIITDIAIPNHTMFLPKSELSYQLKPRLSFYQKMSLK